jgi:uncharacterized protein YqgC (DUF456 family)
VSDVELILAVAMLIGLVGVVVPAVPGLLLIWAAGLAWALLEPGGWARWVVMAVMTALAFVGVVVATVLPARRASTAGVPRWVLVAGAVGIIVGFFAIPVVGALLGGPIAIFLAERARLGDSAAARRTTVQVLKGFGVGMALQLVAGVAMIGVWAVGALNA